MNQDTRRRDSHQQKELTIHEDTYKFLDDSGRFVIRDFSAKRPFSSFLPGIAGPLGIPMWVFYVNRGQAIASFGIENKNNPIMEFEPVYMEDSLLYSKRRFFLTNDSRLLHGIINAQRRFMGRYPHNLIAFPFQIVTLAAGQNLITGALWQIIPHNNL